MQSTPMRAISSRRVRSTLPVARSVHINAGVAGLVGCLFLGKRLGYPKEPMPPHSLTMTMIGASLLWVGCSASTPALTSRRPVSPRCIHQHLRRDGGGRLLLAGPPSNSFASSRPCWCGLRRGCRSCRRHPGLGLRRADGLGRVGLMVSADLLLLRRR